MKPQININLFGNISNLSKPRLLEFNNELNEMHPLNKTRLIEIGQELHQNCIDELNKYHLEQILHSLNQDKVINLKQVKYVFLNHIENALRGKVGGLRKRKVRNTRKMRKSKQKTRKQT